MSGRRPKPINLKIIQGNPGRRPLGRTTGAAFEAGAPQKPDWLDPDSSAEWDRLIAQLADESGLLSPGMGGIVLVACQYFSQLRKANAFIERHGETYETQTESGSTMVREYPQVRQRAEALQGYRKTLSDLCATPAQAPRAHRLPSEQTELPGISRFLT